MNRTRGCCVFLESSRPDEQCPMSPRPRARSLCPLRARASLGRALMPCWRSGGERDRPRGAPGGSCSWHPGWSWWAHRDFGDLMVPGGPIRESERRGCSGAPAGTGGFREKRCACGQPGQSGQARVGDGGEEGAVTPRAGSEPGNGVMEEGHKWAGAGEASVLNGS